MRVAVTGAGGFVGHAVVGTLLEHGHEVVALVRDGSPVQDDVELRQVDVRDRAAMAEALSDVDGVCHLAALGRVRESREDPMAYWETNVGGALKVLSVAAVVPRLSSLVLASTAGVYGPGADRPLAEDALLAPGHPYGASKLSADLAAQGVAETGALGAASLRAFNVAGAWQERTDTDETRLIPKALAVVRGHGELVVNGDGSAVRDFVHVRDMADAFVRALEACRPGHWTPYNIGSGHGATVTEVIATVERIAGCSMAVRHSEPVAEPRVLLADSTRARAELGWKPESSGLDRIVSDAWNALSNGYAAGEYSDSEYSLGE